MGTEKIILRIKIIVTCVIFIIGLFSMPEIINQSKLMNRGEGNGE